MDGEGTKRHSNTVENSRVHERYRQTTDRRTGDDSKFLSVIIIYLLTTLTAGA